MSSTQAAAETPRKYQLFIDGQWVDAESGKTFETPNPATGTTLPAVEEVDGVIVRRFSIARAAGSYGVAPGLWRHIMDRGGEYDVLHAHSYHAFTSLAATLAVSNDDGLWRVVDRCVQVLGGQGVTGETLVSRIFNEVRGFRIYDGPSEGHRWSLAMRAGRLAGEAQDRPTARASYEIAVSAAPTFLPALRGMRRVCVAQGDYAQAREVLHAEAAAGADKAGAVEAWYEAGLRSLAVPLHDPGRGAVARLAITTRTAASTSIPAPHMTLATRQIRRKRGSVSHSASHEPAAKTRLPSIKGRARMNAAGRRAPTLAMNHIPHRAVVSPSLASRNRGLRVATDMMMVAATVATTTSPTPSV